MPPLVSHRVVGVPELGAVVATHALLHTRYRVNAVHNENVVSEDRLALGPLDRRGHVGRPIATVLLEGAARITAHGRSEWLEPGDVLGMDAKAAIAMRQEGRRYASIAFEWDDDWLGPRPAPFTRKRLDDARLAEAKATWSKIVAGTVDGGAVAGLVRLLDLGLVARTSSDLIEEPPEKFAKLSAALDVCFSNLRDQPMIADLERELGLSSRHLNRLVVEFNERYGFNAAGWRDARNRRRLLVGMCLMTSPGATGEIAARAVGYQSLPAFTVALGDAGFPIPSEVVAAVARARDGA